MNPSHLLFNLGLFSAAGFALALASLGLWIIVRRQMRKVNLPALRVLAFENERLPKFRTTPPPWVGFLCFLAAAAAFAFFLARPTELSFTPFDPKQNRNHLVLDMTPSVSGYVSLDQYVSRVLPLFQGLQKTGKVTVSTTGDLAVIEPASSDELASYIRSHAFHPYGVHLGNYMHQLLDKVGEVDRLFVVSDGEESTWGDFNWRFLQDQMEVIWLPVASDLPTDVPNVFVNDASYVAHQDSLNMEWEVELARANAGSETHGQLQVSYAGETLASVPWTMPSGKDRVIVPVAWPSDKVKKKPAAAAEPLLWEMQPADRDALARDNVFRTNLRGDKRRVLLIAEPSGESAIEDHAHHLRVALEVMGMRVTRMDKAPAQKDLGAYSLVIAVGGFGTGVASFCPAGITAKNTAPTWPVLWLVPHDVGADYQELCQCYGNLVEGKPLTSMPLYCATAQHRDHWVDILSSLGASQVGGAVGEVSGALAWRGKIKESQSPIVAFSIPLRPLVQTGVGYGQLPSLVRHMLMLQGSLGEGEKDGDAAGPSRIADATAMMTTTMTPPLRQRLANSNVPTGESQLRRMRPDAMPTSWQGERVAVEHAGPLRKDHDDPFPWILLATWLIIGAGLVEGSVKIIQGRRRPRSGPLLVIALLAGIGMGARPAAAGIDLTMVDAANRPAHIAWLAREVASRTSIDVNPSPRFFAQINGAALKEPWLWIKDTHPVAEARGVMRVDVEAWVKRGGLLIIENARSPETLALLTQRLEPLQRGDGGWQPIPPDHELLRSFHLLESLPVCQDAVWRGYHYDGRLAILAIPFSLSEALADTPVVPACLNRVDREYLARVFVNLAMVALATDYKKDQIHLPEILKRLR